MNYQIWLQVWKQLKAKIKAKKIKIILRNKKNCKTGMRFSKLYQYRAL